jgi:hypothetical protein
MAGRKRTGRTKKFWLGCSDQAARGSAGFAGFPGSAILWPVLRAADAAKHVTDSPLGGEGDFAMHKVGPVRLDEFPRLLLADMTHHFAGEVLEVVLRVMAISKLGPTQI